MPVDPHLVRRAIEARDRFEQTQAEALRARDAFHDAVDAMHRSGASLREIAEALGVSHQRVHQMVDSGGRPSFWARTTRRGSRPRRVTQCSFCGKGQDAVAKLVAGPGVFICNECIGVASGAVALGEAQAGEHATFEILAEASDTRCNFCGKRAREVEAMATGPGGAICDQCLALCQEILAEDRASAGE